MGDLVTSNNEVPTDLSLSLYQELPSPQTSPQFPISRMSDGFDLKICCMGAGYVGGPTMAVIAANCPKVRALYRSHHWLVLGVGLQIHDDEE